MSFKVDFASELEVCRCWTSAVSFAEGVRRGLQAAGARNSLDEPLSDVAFVVREGARLAARSGKERLDQASLLAALRTTPAREREGGEKRRIGFI
jgi:hypothetical protein